jgi:hypothetical protein
MDRNLAEQGGGCQGGSTCLKKLSSGSFHVLKGLLEMNHQDKKI